MAAVICNVKKKRLVLRLLDIQKLRRCHQRQQPREYPPSIRASTTKGNVNYSLLQCLEWLLRVWAVPDQHSLCSYRRRQASPFYTKVSHASLFRYTQQQTHTLEGFENFSRSTSNGSKFGVVLHAASLLEKLFSSTADLPARPASGPVAPALLFGRLNRRSSALDFFGVGWDKANRLKVVLGRTVCISSQPDEIVQGHLCQKGNIASVISRDVVRCFGSSNLCNGVKRSLVRAVGMAVAP